MGFFLIKSKGFNSLLSCGLFCLLLTSEAQARRAYFFGATAYNDNTESRTDAYGNKYSDFIGDRGVNCSIAGDSCHKLYSCNIMISNLSGTTQKITGYAITTLYTYTNNKIGGNAVDYDDPLVIQGTGDMMAWSGKATAIGWDASIANPAGTLYKYDHTQRSTSLTEYTGAVALSLLSGETALLINGNVNSDVGNWGMGGGILENSTRSKLKQIGMCFGYIDVDDDDATQPGFVVASGTMESKAGSYLNRPIYYGNRKGTDEALSIAAVSEPTLEFTAGSLTSKGTFQGCAPWVTGCSARFYSYLFDGALFGAGGAYIADTGDQPLGGGSCAITHTVDAGGAEGSIQADWPEITYNMPILINGGSPF